ncbi:mucin-22-like [Haliotis asinina]|uniref:mucin-22-like n=1 Tax=Haliotis asinina TaxID=109174 RepID=UPI003531B1EB
MFSFIHSTIPRVRRGKVCLAWVLLCVSVGMSESLHPHLTSYPQSAVDGTEVTLSCATTHKGGLIGVKWYRNNVDIFYTSSDVNVSTSILNPNTTSPEFQSVSRRVTVNSYPPQHNVSLRINSTLDKDSVWKCKSGNSFSNNVTVVITDSTQGSASTARMPTNRTESTTQSILLKAIGNPVKDGQILTLTCDSTNNITETVWSRNSLNLFKTILPTSMLVYDTSYPQYQSVTGRVTVSSTHQQHNVTLRINSTLDQGSVWRCNTGNVVSNNVTLHVMGYRRGDAITTITALTRSTSGDGSILLIAAAVASIIVIIVIVVASSVSVLLVRKYKRNIAESTSQLYSTMSRDPDTDNNYSELGPEHTNKRFPTSQRVITEESVAYYNTLPADSQYENPPPSTEKPGSSYLYLWAEYHICISDHGQFSTSQELTRYCRSIEMKISLVVMVLVAGVLSESPHLHLTSYPQSVVDGTKVTLSCATTNKGGVIAVKWYRNNVHIFQTSSDVNVSTSIRDTNTTSSEFQSVSRRVTVNSSLPQHNVSLRINSTLDKDSVWKCKSGNSFSNNVTVVITDSTQGSSSKDHEDATKIGSAKRSSSTVRMPTNRRESTTRSTATVPTTTAQTEPTGSKCIYAVAGSLGAVVVVAVIIIAVLLGTLSRRRENAKEGKDDKEGRFNEYSKKETVVMADNDLYKQYADTDVDGTEHQVSTEKQEVMVMEDNVVYHGFVKAESQKSAEKQQPLDVHSKVNKVKKTNNATEVHITLRIEDMYAKPNKTENGRSEASSRVSSYQSVDVSTPD